MHDCLAEKYINGMGLNGVLCGVGVFNACVSECFYVWGFDLVCVGNI